MAKCTAGRNGCIVAVDRSDRGGAAGVISIGHARRPMTPHTRLEGSSVALRGSHSDPAVARRNASLGIWVRRRRFTPEYQAVLAASIADQAKGGWAISPPPGPGCRHAAHDDGVIPMEFVVTRISTDILVGMLRSLSRFSPTGTRLALEHSATYVGYSDWAVGSIRRRRAAMTLASSRDARRQGPRAYTAVLPPPHDDQSIFKERIYTDKANRNILHDEMTTIDHPYASMIGPTRIRATRTPPPPPRPVWPEYYLTEKQCAGRPPSAVRIIS